MKIWIMNHYAGRMEDDKGGRHYWFSKFLSKKGHQPVVFCSKNKDTVEISHDEEIGTDFVYVNTKGGHNGKFNRIKSMLSFYFNVQKVAKRYVHDKGKPDVILASSVHPLTLVAGIRLAKKYGIKCICEVRDLWPEAIFAYSSLSKDSLIGKVLYLGEKWIYTKADALVFTQEGAFDYIKDKKWDKENGGKIDMSKVFYINNGVDLQAFDCNSIKYIYEDEDLDNPDIFKVVYAGAIRKVNNVDLILDAAKLIKSPQIKFLIYGEGNLLPSLKQRIIDEKIENVVFKGRVNKQFIPSIDCRADLNLAHWKMTPLVEMLGESCNKVFEYCAAGKPIFYTVHPAYSIGRKFDCAIFTSGFTAKDIAEGIETCASLPENRKRQLSENARRAAEHFDFEKLTDDLLKVIETIS